MPTILLVNDDKDLRQGLASLLDHHGFEVNTAGNVSESLTFISSESSPVLLSDLHMPGAGDTKELVSVAASEHGALRHERGYTASMTLEESRLLQVCIFGTLQKNLTPIDFSILSMGVMTIADEVDSQLSQAMNRFTLESRREAVPS